MILVFSTNNIHSEIIMNILKDGIKIDSRPLLTFVLVMNVKHIILM